MITIAKAIYDYFKPCPLLDNGCIRVDYLGPGDSGVEYAIELTPGSQIIKRYIDGATLRQQEFLFACRYFYGADIMQNLANSGFFDELSNWIEHSSDAGILPVLDDGRESRKMEALTCGYLLSEDGQTARYQIQCRFIYHKEA